MRSLRPPRRSTMCPWTAPLDRPTGALPADVDAVAAVPIAVNLSLRRRPRAVAGRGTLPVGAAEDFVGRAHPGFGPLHGREEQSDHNPEKDRDQHRALL